jgi:hypothetical protein
LAGNFSTIQTPAPSGFESAKSGFQNIFSSGNTGTDARARFMEALPYGTTAAAGAPLALEAIKPPPGPEGIESNIRPYEFAWNPTNAWEPTPRPGDSSERLYFNPTYTALPIERAAGGGLMDIMPDPDSNDMNEYAPGGKVKKRSLMGDKFYKFAQDRRDGSMEASVQENFAAGGLGTASKALPPRFLSGGGDGMSDSIKANIDGVQEARLADGEFVIPADVVSHLGNGSSKAGAKKLYSMMDKIRKARTGKTRQAPEVNAQKYMPA